jgi:hypothetical protein
MTKEQNFTIQYDSFQLPPVTYFGQRILLPVHLYSESSLADFKKLNILLEGL